MRCERAVWESEEGGAVVGQGLLLGVARAAVHSEEGGAILGIRKAGGGPRGVRCERAAIHREEGAVTLCMYR